MHILLTDLLTCPRCGPDFGLIVLSDRTADRHVIEGSLGCANCRSIYPVLEGVADLRYASCGELADAPVPPADPDRAVRIAALLGVTGPSLTVLMLERSGASAAGVSPLIPDVHVVGAVGEGPGDTAEIGQGILSRVRLGTCLPFRSGSLAGLAAIGIDIRDLLDEARRTLRPDGRLVVEGGADGLGALLRTEGFDVHLEQDGIVVASPMSRS